jgi:hypothetical protein
VLEPTRIIAVNPCLQSRAIASKYLFRFLLHSDWIHGFGTVIIICKSLMAMSF